MGKGYVRERGPGVFQIAVYIGQKPDGGDDYDYRTVHTETKRDAQKIALDLANKVAQGKYIRPSSMTVEELLNGFLAAKTPPEVKQSTYDFYEKMCRLHLIPDLGKKIATRLRKSEMRVYYQRKVKEGLSQGTAKHLHETMRAALRLAVEDGDLEDNPLDGMKSPHVPDRPATVWDEQEVARFLEINKGHRLYAAWLLALTTGMRRGEILGLRRRDVDLDRMTLQIEQELIATDKGVIFDTPKSASSKRLVELGERTVDALRQRLIDQAAEKRFVGDRYEDSGLVFTTIYGRRIHPRNYDKQFDRAIERAGVPRIRRHDTRHTHITLALKNGENLNAVAARAGHADPAMTVRKYGHVMPTMGRHVANRIEEVYEQAVSAKKPEEQKADEIHSVDWLDMGKAWAGFL